jgi:hypothetical protein
MLTAGERPSQPKPHDFLTWYMSVGRQASESGRERELRPLAAGVCLFEQRDRDRPARICGGRSRPDQARNYRLWALGICPRTRVLPRPIATVI